MNLCRLVLVLTALSAASNSTLAGSPWRGLRNVRNVVRHVERSDARAKSAIQKVRGQVDGKWKRPVVRPLPVPRPIVHPRPPRNPIVFPHPGPLPSPHPIDHVILPVPAPRPIIRPIRCSTPLPGPVPVVNPVEPPVVEPDEQPPLPVIYDGQEVRLPVEGLPAAGWVTLQIGPIVAQPKLSQWESNTVTFQMPMLRLAEPVAGTLLLFADDGTQLAEIAVEFAPAQPKLPQVPLGSRLTLTGEDFGIAEGKVWVNLGQVRLQATVVSWKDSETVVQMPQLELEAPVAAELTVAKPGGDVVERAKIELVAAN